MSDPTPPISKDNPDKSTGCWCADCGHAMRQNVPRMGWDGGAVHADTGSLTCGPYVPPQITTWDGLDGNWMDKDGACRVCGGEIPYGHMDNCDIYKMDKQIRQLNKDKERLDWLEIQRAEIDTDGPGFVVYTAGDGLGYGASKGSHPTLRAAIDVARNL